MIWKVVDVQEEQNPKNRTFIRVHAWHSEAEEGPPLLVADFLLRLSVEGVRAVRNDSGLVKLKNGQWSFPVREVDGEWVTIPDDEVETETFMFDPLEVAEYYIVPVLNRQLNQGRILDIFTDADMPKLKPKNQRKPDHPTAAIEARLKGKRKAFTPRFIGRDE